MPISLSLDQHHFLSQSVRRIRFFWKPGPQVFFAKGTGIYLESAQMVASATDYSSPCSSPTSVNYVPISYGRKPAGIRVIALTPPARAALSYSRWTVSSWTRSESRLFGTQIAQQPGCRSWPMPTDPQHPELPVTTTRVSAPEPHAQGTALVPSKVWRSACTSASTIMATNSPNDTFGSHPSVRLAFVASPINRSTSVGL